MEMRLPTVKVRKGDGWHVINQSDFDPKIHEPWSGDVPPADEPAETPVDISALKVDELKDLAAERGLEVEGTGPGGRVTKSDLVAALG